MKRELNESDDHVDLGLSQATSLAASFSSQLRYGSGPTIDFEIDDCGMADSAPDSDDETQLDEPPLPEVLIYCALSWSCWTCNGERARWL